MSLSAAQWIAELGLQPHPEGGYFRETYRSAESVEAAALPARYGGSRCFGTSIYFLLEGAQFSAFHRLKSDEVWFHHAGGALRVWLLDESGALREERVGPDPRSGDRLQLALPAGTWFAARPDVGAGFALIGCAVAPGFDFADFELAGRAALGRRFPQHRAILAELTRTP
jgi:predicted cupin superfamily sugar epimerase